MMIKQNYLKEIRKLLNLKQQDITKGKITRNTISHIENHKVSLTEKTIELILGTINQQLADNKQIIRLEYDDLFVVHRFEQKLLAESLYNKLALLVHLPTTDLDLIIGEINLLLSKWDFPSIKIHVYDLLGEYFYERYDYTTSLFYFNQGISPAYRIGTLNEIATIISKVMRAEIASNTFGSSLALAKQLIPRKIEIDERIYMKLKFNMALIFEQLKQYEDAIDYLEDLEGLLPQEASDKRLDVGVLKALCLESLDRLDEALEVYNTLLTTIPLSPSDGREINLLCGMMTLYMKQNNGLRINEVIKIILKQLPSISEKDTYLPGIYDDLASGYRYLKKYDLARTYYRKSIDSAILTNEYACLSSALLNYIELHHEIDSIQAHSISILILQLLNAQKVRFDDLTVFSFLSLLESNNAYKELSFFLNQLKSLRKGTHTCN